MSAVVTAEGLSVEYLVGRTLRGAVHEVDLHIEEGEAHGLVGASGSGKSTLAHSLTRFLPRGAVLRSRRLEVAGKNLLTLDGDSLRRYRGHDIGVVFQEPARSLNPTSRIGAQVAETHRLFAHGHRRAAQLAVASLAEIGLDDPDELARRYPHELSGGQQQRVMIAMALAARPRLLILDEPTTGLDAIVRGEVLALISRLRTEHGFAALLISHDLPLVASFCDRVSILDRGRLLETTKPGQFAVPTAPISPPTARTTGQKTAGATRGTSIHSISTPLLRASGLGKRYGSRAALDDVDLQLGRGETLAIVGETGSGKTTLGRVIAGVTSFDGSVVINAPRSPRPVQMVFQSPEASLNPRRTVRQTLVRAVRLLRGDEAPELLAARVRLPLDVLDKMPHQLSGGQKQRVAIARAFAGSAPIIVCDEPTSSLDVDVQGVIIDLLMELQERTGVSYLFISHDLDVVKRVAHRVAVMRHGRVLETVPTATFFAGASHPYTRDLVSAAVYRTRFGTVGQVAGTHRSSITRDARGADSGRSRGSES